MMKKFAFVLLVLVDLLCIGLIFFRLFTTPAMGAALAAILLPTIAAFLVAAAAGHLTTTEQQEPAEDASDWRNAA